MERDISFNNILEKAGLEVAERVLGLGDRRQGSTTCGCYDRMYWKYKLIDYPSSWFQSAVEYLLLLWKQKNTIFYHNRQLANWCVDAYNFTLDNLNKDGSCIEVYPYQRSYCATAFNLGHLCSVYHIFPSDTKSMDKLRKMGIFLTDNIEDRPSNQLAAAALAEFRLAKLTNDDIFYKNAYKKIETLYTKQKEEGYFEEYGGADIGYLSLTLSLFARIDNEFPNIINRIKISKAATFLDELIMHDGSYDELLTSRRTQFLYPFGLGFWKSSALNKLKNGLREGVVICPSWLDDRYFISLAIDYLYISQWLQKNDKE